MSNHRSSEEKEALPPVGAEYRESRRVRFVYEMVLAEEFARWDGEPQIPTTQVPGFKVWLRWGEPTHVSSTTVSSADGTAPAPTSQEDASACVPLLHAEPTTAFDSLAAAREAFESRLREWELHLDLNEGLAVEFEMRSIYASTPDDAWEELKWGTSGYGTFMVFRPVSQLPLPETWGIGSTPLVDQLRDQWRQFRSGRAKLLDRAYCCLTFIERAYGGRRGAAQRLYVSDDVLKKIGALTASSDPRYARKAGHGPAQLDQSELRFLETAIPRLIFRVAEVESAITVDQLTLADFRSQ